MHMNHGVDNKIVIRPTSFFRTRLHHTVEEQHSKFSSAASTSVRSMSDSSVLDEPLIAAS
jgi:hypothetical protein